MCNRISHLMLVMTFVLSTVILSAHEAIGPHKSARTARREGSIILDGRLDEEAWTKAPVHTGFERLLTVPDRLIPATRPSGACRKPFPMPPHAAILSAATPISGSRVGLLALLWPMAPRV